MASGVLRDLISSYIVISVLITRALGLLTCEGNIELEVGRTENIIK